MLSNSKVFGLMMLCLCLLIGTIMAADYAQVPYRQNPKQRATYQDTASSRYSDRLTARAKTAETAASAFTPTTKRPSFVTQYSKQREFLFHNEYSTNRVDFNIKSTPRDDYLKQFKALSSSVQAELTQKRHRLQELYNGSNDPWLSLSTPEFIDFALRGPRPYWLWLTLTVLDTSTHCPTCTTYHSYWEQVTPGFKEASINNPDDPTPMVMALVQPHNAKEIWRALQLNRAPVSVLLPPDFDLNAKIEIQNVMSSGVTRQTMMMNPSREDLITPLEANGFPVKLPPPPQPGIFLLSFAFTLIAGLMYVGYLCFPWLMKLQQHRAIFLIPTLIFYLYAAAGGGFIKSNKPPMTGYIHGMEAWIHREYTQMYGLELYVIMITHAITAFGLWCGVIALAPLGLHQSEIGITTPVSFERDNAPTDTSTPTTTDSSDKTEMKIVTSLDQATRFERRVAYKIFTYLNPDILFAIGFGIFFVGYYTLLQTYKIKMPSYPFGF